MAGLIAGGILLLVLLLLALVAAFGARAKARLAARYPPPGQMVDVGGYRLHVHCQDNDSPRKAPTVVIDAAYGEFSLLWDAIRQGVARFAPVCILDRAGMGWSERRTGPYTALKVVEEMETALAGAGVEPPYVLAGHSLGGVHVRLFAYEHPDQVAGMVLVDPTHEDQYRRLPEAFCRQADKSLKQMPRSMRLFEFLNAFGLLALLPGQFDKAWPVPMADETRETCLSVALSGTRYFGAMREELGALYESLSTLRGVPDPGLGDVPLIVLSASYMAAPDQLDLLERQGISAEIVQQVEATQKELHAELAALSANGRQVVVPDSGHHIYYDQPQAVIDAIREVVEAVQSAAST